MVRAVIDRLAKITLIQGAVCWLCDGNVSGCKAIFYKNSLAFSSLFFLLVKCLSFIATDDVNTVES